MQVSVPEIGASSDVKYMQISKASMQWYSCQKRMRADVCWKEVVMSGLVSTCATSPSATNSGSFGFLDVWTIECEDLKVNVGVIDGTCSMERQHSLER